MAKSNKSILEHILSYCDEIKATIDRFGDNVEIFINDIDYRKSVSLSILQIGELAGNLSEDYRSSTSEIPWKQIIPMEITLILLVENLTKYPKENNKI